jgi:hydroxymethylbilane synthase
VTTKIGTRGSALALAQARQIAAALDELGLTTEISVVRTEGDTSTASLATMGGTGVFASALRAALLAGDCDLVVHSLKDLPVDPAPGLSIVAVPLREDPRDVLCAADGQTLADLPAGATVGTGSPRRAAQVLAARSDLAVVDIRGNVDSRLRRVIDGELDAVVLSRAGLVRIGRTEAITEMLPLDSWPTAAGQGALALEVRAADAAHLVAPFPAPTPLGAAAAALADAASWDAVAAERAVLGALEAGCAAPIGVASAADETGARVWATVYRPGGSSMLERDRHVVFDPASAQSRRAVLLDAARSLAQELLDSGAADVAPLGRTA